VTLMNQDRRNLIKSIAVLSTGFSVPLMDQVGPHQPDSIQEFERLMANIDKLDIFDLIHLNRMIGNGETENIIEEINEIANDKDKHWLLRKARVYR